MRTTFVLYQSQCFYLKAGNHGSQPVNQITQLQVQRTQDKPFESCKHCKADFKVHPTARLTNINYECLHFWCGI